MQQRNLRQASKQDQPRYFTASEVAEFEYCPLAWWHDQYEPASHADDDTLFARMVELEQKHGTQAPADPEYQMLERLLVRRGAFDEGHKRHEAHAQEVGQIQEEAQGVRTTGRLRQLSIAILVLVILAALLIATALLLRL